MYILLYITHATINHQSVIVSNAFHSTFYINSQWPKLNSLNNHHTLTCNYQIILCNPARVTNYLFIHFKTFCRVSSDRFSVQGRIQVLGYTPTYILHTERQEEARWYIALWGLSLTLRSLENPFGAYGVPLRG